MFSEYFLFFNVLLFSGFGLDIIFGHKRDSFRPYFRVCAVNAFTMTANSLFFFALKEPFFAASHVGDRFVFLMMPAAALMVNEFLLAMAKHSDFNVFDSLNFTGAVFPMFVYSGARDLAGAALMASGAAAGFLVFSTLFFHVKRRAGEQCGLEDDFTAFCYEMLIFGLFSASFSIFFKVV